jgi:NAD(P)-dependent dehydrogenase (short-subunit alcohol dehydrogenase family)
LASLDGKVAIVTGGARGLGAAICRMLAREGAFPVIADVREELARGLASELGEGALPLYFDVSNADSIASGIESVKRRYGQIDILVNNAGTDVTKPIEELSVEDFDRIVAVNLRAPFLTAKAVLPDMMQRGSGSIVNIVSTAAKRAWAEASAYHASKWGLLGLSHAMHVEARAKGVKVTAVVAGGMRTGFLYERFPDIDSDTLQPPENVAETVRFVLMQPPETVVPEVTAIPMRETSWP